MAEALAQIGHNGAAGNVLAGMSQAEYLRLLEQYEEADQAVADAVAGRKDLRANIKARGVPLKAWDRARHDAEVSGEKREIEELAYRQMMAWRMKPVGWQASMDLRTDDPGLAALNVHELHRIDTEGFNAGKGGRRRDQNSYTPGTEAYQRFDTAWMRGQAEIAATLGGSAGNGAEQPRPADTAAADTGASPRRRGRPPGSKDKQKRRRTEAGGEPAEEQGDQAAAP